jgi:hypothetical protein
MTSAPVFSFTRRTGAHISLAVALSCPLAAQADVLIDDFSAGDWISLTDSGSFSESVANVLGGVREIFYDYESRLRANNLSLITSDPGMLASGTLNIAGIDNKPKSFSLTYDGLIGSGANLDMNMASASAIVVRAMSDFWTTPTSASTLNMTLTDAQGVTGSLSIAPNSPAFMFDEVIFDLSDAAYAGLDLAHIDRISMNFESALSADTFFDSIEIRSYAVALPVPEADSVVFMLLGMGLVGMLARRRG